jgi:hypothetical protein
MSNDFLIPVSTKFECCLIWECATCGHMNHFEREPSFTVPENDMRFGPLSVLERCGNCTARHHIQGPVEIVKG